MHIVLVMPRVALPFGLPVFFLGLFCDVVHWANVDDQHVHISVTM